MSALLHEGTSFLVSDDFGDIDVDGNRESGLFCEDSRFLSCLKLRLDGQKPILLSRQGISDAQERFFLSNGTLGKSGKSKNKLPQNVLFMVRERSLRERAPGGFQETIQIRYCGDREQVKVGVELTVDADFEHIYFVKQSSEAGGGDLPVHHVSREELDQGSCLRLTFEKGPVFRRCILHFSERPQWVNGTARFEAVISNDKPWKLQLNTEMISGKGKEEHSVRGLSREQCEKSHTRRNELNSLLPVLETDHALLRKGYEAACRDLISLRIKSTEAFQKFEAIAAGIPWYMALFGRDSLITSCESLWADPSIARGTLKSLAKLQGTQHDPVSLEAPGKILHEYRKSRIAGTHKAIPKFPYYGTVDATPLFIIALSEYSRWTGDLSLARELWQNVLDAISWMREAGDPDHDGFLEYTSQKNGLVNQGWKDSDDSVRFADGTIAHSPISLVEVQGYKVCALRRAAELANHLGHQNLAKTLTQEGDSLAAKLVQRFWLKRCEFFAEALDGKKNPVDSLTSNPGHLLWTEAIDPERARKVTQRFFAPEFFTGYGIRTMASSQGGYNPVSYHNGSVWPHDNALILTGLMHYGFRDHATRLIEALLQALSWHRDLRYSELFSGIAQNEFHTVVGYPSACKPQAWASGAMLLIVRNILGIEANAMENRFEAKPLRIDGLSYLRLRELRFGDQILEIDAKLSAGEMKTKITRNRAEKKAA